jgi:SUF system NifU family Fe-S assembly protein
MPSDGEIEALYRDVVLAHYREPRHRAPLASPDGRGHAVNPTCGDAVDVEVALRDGRIAEVSARALGCSIAVAAGSVIADVILGREPAEAGHVADELARIVAGREVEGADPRLQAFAPLANVPARQRCALLACEALAAALDDAAK